MPMFLVRLLLFAVMLAVAVPGCSRGPQGDPRDAVAVEQLIARLDAEAARLEALFELRGEVESARGQLVVSQRELAQDFPELAQAGNLATVQVPSAAQGRVRAFRASVAEYDRLVARHNALARDLETYLDGRSPQDVRRLLQAMRQLRATLADMLAEANYTRAVYIARHSELVQALGLQSPNPAP